MEQKISLNDGKIGVIRYAKEEDAKQIIKKMERMIRDENYLEEDEETLNEVEDEMQEIKKIKREGSLYALVDVEEDIAGVIILKRGNLDMNHHTTNLRVWITEKYRGQGLGMKLMEYGIKWSEENGIEKICLDVFDNNEKAIKLYEKFGFITEGRRKKQFILNDIYVDEIFMSRFMD